MGKLTTPRASKYDKPSVSQAVLDGMTLNNLSCFKACAAAGVPHPTFLLWVSEDTDLADRYARAREALIERMAEDILDIADDGTNDTYMDEDGCAVTNHDVIARSRLRVDARKWLLSKLAPKKYGDKVEVDHTGDVTINQITRRVIDPLTIDQKLKEISNE